MTSGNAFRTFAPRALAEPGALRDRLAAVRTEPFSAPPERLSGGPDNDDLTARNCWMLRDEAGLPYEESVHWNVVPWYLGTPAA
ncbi:MAG TPA: hypothetical protein VIS29_20465 [Streptomyces sp.]